jgi:mannitol 2-dehydrogenase
MQKIIDLNTKGLSILPTGVEFPAYDRSELKTGIIHVGPGGFHRTHQAYYVDELLKNHGIKDWAICGVGLMEPDRLVHKRLKSQDHLYTLMVNNPDGTFTARVIGSITGYMFAPDDPDAVIEKMAHPDTRIVSLTITEGGYNFNQVTGEFQSGNTDIQHDLRHPNRPKTIFGFLAESLKRRMDRGLPAYTVLSCDNIQHNGDVAKRMVLAFADIRDKALRIWIEQNVSFPNSMVDRITPVTREENKMTLQKEFGINDSCPVICEPFCQWVIEDYFSSGRPPWEKAGVQFVKDVSPFEKMKIRLLNAGHSLLGFTGALYGYTFIHEVVHDQLFARFLRDFMDIEVTPVLDEVPGINLDFYKNSLFERFGNPQIKDNVARICLQSSAKIPKFLLPTVNDQLKAGGSVNRSAFVVAAWCRYAEGSDEKGNKYPVEDDMKVVIQEAALRSRLDPLAFLKIETIFGDLAYSGQFTEAYQKALQCIYKNGVATSIREMNFD